MTDCVVSAAQLCFRRDVSKISIPTHIQIKRVDGLTLLFDIFFPSGTYQELTISFQLTAKQSYPFDPPKIVCLNSHIFHPSVCPKTNIVCLNLLRLDWMPSICLESIVVSIQCLFMDDQLVDMSEPLHREAAELMMRNRAEYCKKSRASINMY